MNRLNQQLKLLFGGLFLCILFQSPLWANSYAPIITLPTKAEITDTYLPVIETKPPTYSEELQLNGQTRFILSGESLLDQPLYPFFNSVDQAGETLSLTYTISTKNGNTVVTSKTLDLLSSPENAIEISPNTFDPDMLDIRVIFQPGNLQSEDPQQLNIATLNSQQNLVLEVDVAGSDYSYSSAVTVSRLTVSETENPTLLYQAPSNFNTEQLQAAFAPMQGLAGDISDLTAPITTLSGASLDESAVRLPLRELSSSPVINLNYAFNFQTQEFSREQIQQSREEISYMTFSFGDSSETELTTSPHNNSDLNRLMELAHRAQALGLICQKMECPKLDCKAARKLMQELFNGKVYLRAMSNYAKQDVQLKLQQYVNLMRQEIITGENLYNIQIALATQEFLHKFGATLLDIASVYEYIEEMADDIGSGNFSGDDMSLAEFLDKIDSAYEAASDLAGGAQNLGNMGELSEMDINTHKSTLSNIKEIVKNAAKAGKDWRKALTNRKSRLQFGQIIGRYLETYSATLIKERRERLSELLSNVNPEAIARAHAFNELQKARIRLDKIEQTLQRLEQALAALRPCIEKLCGKVELHLKEVFEIQKADLYSLGKALKYFNEKIPQIIRSISVLLQIEISDDCPPLMEDIYWPEIDPDLNNPFQLDNPVKVPAVDTEMEINLAPTLLLPTFNPEL